jgi:hypothetical protein
MPASLPSAYDRKSSPRQSVDNQNSYPQIEDRQLAATLGDLLSELLVFGLGFESEVEDPAPADELLSPEDVEVELSEEAELDESELLFAVLESRLSLR